MEKDEAQSSTHHRESTTFGTNLWLFAGLFILFCSVGVIVVTVTLQSANKPEKTPKTVSGIPYQQHTSVPVKSQPMFLQHIVQQPVTSQVKEKTAQAGTESREKKRRTFTSRHGKKKMIAVFTHTGKALFIKNEGEYTYVKTGGGRQEQWLAVSRTERIKNGDTVEFPDKPAMLNYYCKALDSTLDKIIFAAEYRVNGELISGH